VEACPQLKAAARRADLQVRRAGELQDGRRRGWGRRR
jgi:hypothetical protein